VKSLADELDLAFEYYKEELVTEQEVDANYQKVVKGLVLLAAVIFDVMSKREKK
jgi:ribose/xylose/arabinose/galactoside ABC-type transport system permease subunit